MTATVLLALFGVGVAVGLLSGLIGIGGGVLIVPFLYFFYGHPAWSGAHAAPELHAAIAHATSLFIIVPTALRGTLAFQRAELVAWRTALPVALTSMAAAVVGARLALGLPAELLKTAFGVLLIASAGRMVHGSLPEPVEPGRGTVVRSLVAGLVVGLVSALLGVGGGLIAIPLLVYLVGLDLRRVSATSLAVIAFSAASGTITYMVSGVGAAGRPPGSLGYVHAAAAIPMLLGSVLAVRWGALANQRLGGERLRYLFAVVFAAMGAWLAVRNGFALL